MGKFYCVKKNKLKKITKIFGSIKYLTNLSTPIFLKE